MAHQADPQPVARPATTAAPKPTRRTSIGMFLAIIAGLLALGVIVWPIVPIAEAGAGGYWLVLAGGGLAFLLGAFLALTQGMLARLCLAVGVVALVGGAAFLSGLFDGRPAVSGALLYLVPAALGLIAAAIIEPARPATTTE